MQVLGSRCLSLRYPAARLLGQVWVLKGCLAWEVTMPQIRFTGFLASLVVREMFLVAPILLAFLINFNLIVSHQRFPILCI